MEKKPLVVEEENSIAEAEVAGENINGKLGSQTRFSDRDSPKPTSPAGQEDNNKFEEEDDQLTSTRAEVGEAREENERLKKVLTRIVKDYKALQMHFFDIVQQDQVTDPPKITSEPIDLEEPELVSLRLGTSSSGHKKEEKKSEEGDNRKKEGLTLGLDSKFDNTCNNIIATKLPSSSSPDNSSEDAKEEEAGEPWPPSKIAKNLRSTGDDEVTPQAQVKRARVSVRARCETPTMNDGCQWRKYGQKVSKGNPCPRAYYRCTVAPLCPVRKQVQRCADDMSILITTYEGTHNHPLPVSATAMASTTSAAACMLTSGSSAPRLAGSSSMPSSSSTAYPHGLNYPITDNIRPSQFYLPNQLITPSNSHPTITLDLTNKYSSNFTPTPRYTPTPTTFNFSSMESNPIPTWSSNSGYSTTSYNGTAPFNKSHSYPLNQTYWQRAANSGLAPPAPNNLSTDTIARAITSDPSFQSALAAAITSYVGTRGVPQGGGGGDANVYGSRYLNRTGSLGSSHQEGSLMLLQHPPPPMGLSTGAKSASASPVDDMEQTG